MTEVFKNKYRIRSARLPYWDYSGNGWYFITICTKNMVNYFGEIREQVMGLNDIGCIAAKSWQDIPKHFKYVRLDEWVIMPNHVHGIIVIDKPNSTNVETLQCNISTGGQSNNKTHQFFSKISPKPQSLSTIIRSFKSIVTKTINKKYPEINFTWQPRYYDHIIRNEKSLNKIREYIFYNPQMWNRDNNNSNKL